MSEPSPLKVVRRRRLGRAPAAAIVLAALALIVLAMASNPRFEWGTVGHYLFDPIIISGAGATVGLTLIAMSIGIVLGVVLAVMRESGGVILSSAAGLYIWFFRGTPQLVQLIFWYNIGALYPKFSLGIPFGPQWFSVSANDVVTPLATAIFGLGLNEAAYMAEIVRAGLVSVGPGQREAAAALGLSRWHAFTRIVLPQAMRVIIPPTGNQVISMLKATSLVSVIALAELLYSAQSIYSRTFETIPVLIVVCIWYLAMTTVLSIGQQWLEHKFSAGSRKAPARVPPSLPPASVPVPKIGKAN